MAGPVSVRFLPETGGEVLASCSGQPGQSLLDLWLSKGVDIDHACGGECACSTCHIYVESGMDVLSEAEEDEEDRVEEAPGLQQNSRLSCQCRIEPGHAGSTVVVRVPGWNRNEVREASD